MRLTFPALFVFAVACAGTSSDARQSAANPGDGVSFGGAQDIGQLRSILDRGEIPGPDTFDANGFFNEHYNAMPPAGCGNLLCVAAGMSVGRDWLAGAHQATLQLSITSAVDPATLRRLPMNLVVVVDRSGSMASDGRLDKVKVGLHTLIDSLRDEDRLALVKFDDKAEVDATFGTALDRAALHAIVSRLEPRGATNIYDGLRQGFLLLGDAPPSARQNRVIFVSDGNATAGDTSPEHIMGMASDRVQRGIGLTTIGVGIDFDVGLMRGLAEQGAGNFYFLEDPAAATEVFTEELDTFVQPIALDVRLETVAGPGYHFDEVIGSRLWSAGSNRGEMHIPAVFAASRTSQGGGQGRRGGGSMIFVHMTPRAGGTGRVASMTLSFRTPGSPERISQTVTLDYASDPAVTPDEAYLSAPEMAERFAMYNMFLGIRAATLSDDPDCAIAVLEATRAGATAWNRSHEDPDIAADLMLVEQYLENLRTRGAVGERSLVACRSANDPYEPIDGEPQPVDDIQRRDWVCSTGGAGGGGLTVVLAALALVLRRRS
jgi:Ca-activated chloride channel homolog